MAVAQMDTSGLPRGELLGRYRSYEDAQKVVDHLAGAQDFDVKALTIVGNDLRSVERIRSRLTYPKVAGAGAAQGAMFGLFIGLLIFLFSPEAPLLNLLLSIVLGMAIWMIIGVIGYAVRRGQRDFASSQQLVATTHDVVCDYSQAGKARQRISGAGVQSLNAWNDPTGRSDDLAGVSSSQGSQGTTTSEQGTPAAGGEQSPSSETPAPRRDDGDLPDGRPRYGVRLEDKRETTETDAEHNSEAERPMPAGEEPAPDAQSR